MRAPGVPLLLQAACLVPHISELSPHSLLEERGEDPEASNKREKAERTRKREEGRRRWKEREEERGRRSPLSLPGLNLCREDAETSRRAGCSGSGVERRSHQRYGR